LHFANGEIGSEYEKIKFDLFYLLKPFKVHSVNARAPVIDYN